MSTATADLRATAARPAAADRTRPALRVVPRRSTVAGRLPFAILVGGILAAGLVSLLLLHTMAAQDAFRLRDLQRQAADLRDAQQQLQVAGQQMQAPAALAARARHLGMVPTGSISFVKLRSGRVVGVAHAAPAPQASSTPSPSPSTKAAKATADAKPGASSGSGGAKPAGCSHAHCRSTARRP
jgi:hypothetical protein